MLKIIIIIILAFTATTTSVVYHKTQQADINYFQGHRLFEDGKYSQAEVYFKKALAKDPARINALRDMAYCYHWTGKRKEALVTFKKILLINPKDYKIQQSLAEILSWQKKYDESIFLYREIIDATDSYDAKIGLAQTYLWSGQPKQAIGLLEMLSKDRQGDFKSTSLLVQAMLEDGKLSEAANLIDKLSADGFSLSGKRQVEIKELRAQLYIKNKDFAAAIREYKDILSRDPRNPKVRISLAEVLSWEGRYKESISEFKEALSANPTDLEIKKKLAEVYTWNKDYHNAEKLYKEVVRQNPDDFDSYAAIWEIMIARKKYTDALIYFDAVLSKRKDRGMLYFYVKKLLLVGDYKHAIDILRNMLEWDPSDIDTRIYLADVLSYDKQFAEAESLYRVALDQRDDIRVKKKLADVLSWDRKYAESLKLYDEILAKDEDPNIRLQKARVLGWDRRYPRSLEEYRNILSKKYYREIELEMLGKDAYWDGRVERAISIYRELTNLSPNNLEAMFDLSQIYAYQSMWQDAINEYNQILRVEPMHFRAKEGKEKALLILKHPSLRSGYEFFEADSPSRDSDIKRSSFFNRYNYRLSYRLAMDLDYRLTHRKFSDFPDVTENEGRIGLAYLSRPEWWAGLFYDFILYNRNIRTMHTFGANINVRSFDRGVSQFTYARERLENNSTVIRNHLYSDNYKARFDLEMNKRLKLGADYLYSRISDSNYKIEPGLDALFNVWLDPRRLSLRYRYFYRNFNKKVTDYFSPKGFSTNSLGFNWRHYLNKEEVFFGADELYYDAGYEATVDSKGIVGHKFSAEINWDINKRLNFNVKGTLVNSSASVYKDRAVVAGLKYYF